MRAGVERVAKLAAERAETAAEAADKEREEKPEEEKPEKADEKKPPKRKREKKARGKKSAAIDEEDKEESIPTEEAKKKQKQKRALLDDLIAEWRQFERELSTAERACGQAGGGPVFAFVEGALVTALKEGRWILLDEINLAPAETLERLGGVLESAHGSVVLSERGDGAAVPRHPRFRLFGAMNPATDVGQSGPAPGAQAQVHRDLRGRVRIKRGSRAARQAGPAGYRAWKLDRGDRRFLPRREEGRGYNAS